MNTKKTFIQQIYNENDQILAKLLQNIKKEILTEYGTDLITSITTEQKAFDIKKTVGQFKDQIKQLLRKEKSKFQSLRKLKHFSLLRYGSYVTHTYDVTSDINITLDACIDNEKNPFIPIKLHLIDYRFKTQVYFIITFLITF